METYCYTVCFWKEEMYGACIVSGIKMEYNSVTKVLVISIIEAVWKAGLCCNWDIEYYWDYCINKG